MAPGLGRGLFVAMFKEEWRLHRSFVGSIGSGFFPIVIFMFSLVLAMTSPLLLRNIDTHTILTILHIAAIIYGLMVGALGALGEQVMTRRLGQVNLLLQLPLLFPISFKKTMTIFFLKDVLYYILYSMIPLIGGIAVAAPFVGVGLGGVALFGLTMSLTFIMGMSLSFMISALYVRSQPAAGLLMVGLVILILMVWPLGQIPIGQIIPALGYWSGLGPIYVLVSASMTILFSIGAIMFTKERFETVVKAQRNMLLSSEAGFSFTGDLSILVAKEWVELRRSGTMGAVVSGFLGPLLAIYVLVWVFNTGMDIPIEFNVLFYGGMVGFLGTMTYSWLTNLEPNEFLNVQPVSVAQVIKAKLVLYFLLTILVSFAYVIVIGVINEETDLLPLALFVAGVTTVYVAAVTSWLTGLWTNTMLFDAKVLGKFSMAIMVPLIILMVASFWIRTDPTLAIAIVMLVSLGSMIMARALFKGISRRWGGSSFSQATNP